MRILPVGRSSGGSERRSREQQNEAQTTDTPGVHEQNENDTARGAELRRQPERQTYRRNGGDDFERDGLQTERLDGARMARMAVRLMPR